MLSRFNNEDVGLSEAVKASRIGHRHFHRVMNIILEVLDLEDGPRPTPCMEEQEEQEQEQEAGSNLDYENSDSPPEYWSDEEEEWPIKGIVGEEVTTAGDVKSVSRSHPPSAYTYLLYRYEVSWKPWQRPDGSCTLWMWDIPDRPDLARSWKKKAE